MLDLVQTPAQKEIIDRLTGLMTLLEGHAEFVMDGVGPEVVPTVGEIRARFNDRRAGRHNPIERVDPPTAGCRVEDAAVRRGA